MKDSALPLATESYRRHLDAIIRTEGLFELFDCTAEDYSVDPILSEISQNFIDVSGFVDFLQNSGAEMVLAEIARSGLLDGEAGRRVIFAPCSPLVQKALDELARAFPEGLFLDSSRCGQKIDGRTILAPDAVVPEEGDVCIILTRNTEAAASYERQFGKANCLNFLDIYPKALFATVSPEAARLVGRINACDKAILFASPRPMGTISSTIAQMQRDGYGTFWFGSEDVKADYQTGYSTPKTTDVALDDYAIGDLSDLLFVTAPYALSWTGTSRKVGGRRSRSPVESRLVHRAPKFPPKEASIKEIQRAAGWLDFWKRELLCWSRNFVPYRRVGCWISRWIGLRSK